MSQCSLCWKHSRGGTRSNDRNPVFWVGQQHREFAPRTAKFKKTADWAKDRNRIHLLPSTTLPCFRLAGDTGSGSSSNNRIATTSRAQLLLTSVPATRNTFSKSSSAAGYSTSAPVPGLGFSQTIHIIQARVVLGGDTSVLVP